MAWDYPGACASGFFWELGDGAKSRFAYRLVVMLVVWYHPFFSGVGFVGRDVEC